MIYLLLLQTIVILHSDVGTINFSFILVLLYIPKLRFCGEPINFQNFLTWTCCLLYICTTKDKKDSYQSGSRIGFMFGHGVLQTGNSSLQGCNSIPMINIRNHRLHFGIHGSLNSNKFRMREKQNGNFYLHMYHSSVEIISMLVHRIL